jgi:flavin-binding protein dodecin
MKASFFLLNEGADVEPDVLGRDLMSLAKIIELSGQSPNSYEDATREVMERASRTLRNIRSIWVKEFEAVVENNRVSQFRVIVKVTFVLDEGESVDDVTDSEYLTGGA